MAKETMAKYGSNTVVLNWIDSHVMKEVLRFVYSEKIEDLDEIAYKMAIVAKKLKMEKLMRVCVANIIATLSPENIFAALGVAVNLGDQDDLMRSCLDMIVG